MLQIEPEVTGSTLGDPSEESDRSSQLRETERPGPHRDRTPEGKFRIYEGRYTWDTPPDEVWGMGVHKRARVGMGDSRDVEPITTKLEIRPVSAKRARMRNALPRPPEPPPNDPTRTSSTFSDPRRRGRLKTRAENVSNTGLRAATYTAPCALESILGPYWRVMDEEDRLGGTYQTARVLVRLFLPFSTPSKWLRYPTGGLRMVNIRCNEHTRTLISTQKPVLPYSHLKHPGNA
ncbi:hypothetical protein EDD15DRAFT_2274963 [Pisolithus albus]|nr:hypothetical protein EDD15DRAFT_2274963 [Pisolithus albus]